MPVSYTHLNVYKRQKYGRSEANYCRSETNYCRSEANYGRSETKYCRSEMDYGSRKVAIGLFLVKNVLECNQEIAF